MQAKVSQSCLFISRMNEWSSELSGVFRSSAKSPDLNGRVSQQTAVAAEVKDNVMTGSLSFIVICIESIFIEKIEVSYQFGLGLKHQHNEVRIKQKAIWSRQHEVSSADNSILLSYRLPSNRPCPQACVQLNDHPPQDHHNYNHNYNNYNTEARALYQPRLPKRRTLPWRTMWRSLLSMPVLW